MTTEQLSEIETPATRQEAPQADPAVEAKARETGWVPLEEYKGDPAKWKPADKWKSPDEQLGTMRKKLEKTEAAFAKFKRDTADNFARTERMNAAAIKQARQDIIDKYEAEKKAAVKTGDEDAFDKAEAAKTKALKNLDDEAEKANGKGKDDGKSADLSPEDIETVEDWKDENPWFDANEAMRNFADKRFVRIRRRDPDMAMEDVLGEVRKAVEEQFPDEFGKRRTNGSKVEGGNGGDMGGNGAGRSLFLKLPAEAKAQADRFIKEGLFLEKGETAEKNMAQARERYARKYLEDSK